MPCFLEVPIDTVSSAEAAILGGAHRLELCSALAVGGVTPSVGFVKAVIALRDKYSPSCRLVVMVRPRTGDFCYSQEEGDMMSNDISSLANVAGVDGFVLGALTKTGDVDFTLCERLLSGCNGLPVTFHRAIDFCIAEHLAERPGTDTLAVFHGILDRLVSIGISRLLTSGGQMNAYDGRFLIKSLINYVNKKGLNLVIVPGCGVTIANAADIIDHTGCIEVHSSCKSLCENVINGKKEDKADEVAADFDIRHKMLVSFGADGVTQTLKDAVIKLRDIVSNK